MALKPEVKRWIEDKIHPNPRYEEHPKKVLDRVEATLSGSNREERFSNVQSAKAYTTLYYKDRHNTEVPKDVSDRLGKLDQRLERLKEVDEARVILARYGGPPTAKTLRDSLARSAASLQMGKAESKTETVPPPTAQRSAASPEQKLRAHAVKDHAQVIAGTPQKEKTRSAGAQMDMGM